MAVAFARAQPVARTGAGERDCVSCEGGDAVGHVLYPGSGAVCDGDFDGVDPRVVAADGDARFWAVAVRRGECDCVYRAGVEVLAAGAGVKSLTRGVSDGCATRCSSSLTLRVGMRSVTPIGDWRPRPANC